MISSFYTAGVGAIAQQEKLNVISNNMANVNTTGFKASTAVFADLLYTDLPGAQAGGHLQKGHGVKLDKTDFDLRTSGALENTGGRLDFAINGNGFFAVQDLDGEDTFYTRDGRFAISSINDELYLTNTSGKVVLDPDGEPIIITEEMTKNPDQMSELINLGVYDFPVVNGMEHAGFNNFLAVEKNGEPEVVESPDIINGYLEASNTDMATEMSRVIEAQRAFSYTLKMVQTSDEVEQEINSLRR